jgi:PAS domain S-box-containing protein
MTALLRNLTIRWRIVLLVLAIVLPIAAAITWVLLAGLPGPESIAGTLATRRNTIIGVAMGVVVLALAVAWHMSALITRPIVDLVGAAAAVAAGSAGARASPGGPPEAGAIAQRLNHMLDACRASDAARIDTEQRYRTLVDWLPEAISVHRDGKVVFVNQACVELLHARSADDLLGKASVDFIHPDFQPATQAAVNDVVERGLRVSKQEQVFVRLDGSTVETEVHATPIVFDGQPAVLASLRDITARKRTELALAASEAQLRGIFDTATVAIVTADQTQTIVNANAAAAAAFGCSIDSLIGAPLERLIPARFRQAHQRDVQAFGDSEISSRHMGHLRGVMGLRTDGSEFPIDAAISHLEVDGRRLYTVILRDTTERHEAEAALRESEASLRRLLVSLPEAVLVKTGERISFVNEAAQQLFGAGEAALIGRAPLELIHADSFALVSARFAALRDGAPVAPLTEIEVLRADGATRIVESAATRVENKGGASIVMIMRDVTELAEARKALAESHADLQRLVAAQDRVQEDERKRIARELHDDLQQTLAAIRIDLVAIGQRLVSAPNTVLALLSETGELAATAIDSTRRIINDLRPQMLEDLGLVPALEALAAQFNRRTGIECRLDAPDDPAQQLSLSPTAATCLYRVAQEALGNVARHAQASAVRLCIESTASGGVTLRIDDNGKGMLTGQQRKPESFGLLGMHERVRALGAALRITSLPGSGTTIEVTVTPARVAQRQPVVDARDHDEPPASGDLRLTGIIDALDGNVAVLDRNGVVVLVNRAWREFAERNGAPGMPGCGPGTNYLAVCRASAAGDKLAQRALHGLTAVLAGEQHAFALEYPCDSAEEKRWFRMRVAPIEGSRILVTHVELSVEAVALET